MSRLPAMARLRAVVFDHAAITMRHESYHQSWLVAAPPIVAGNSGNAVDVRDPAKWMWLIFVQNE